MFYCDLLAHCTNSTSLRPYQVEIEGNMEECAINYIDDVKIGTWPRRKGPYLVTFKF